MDKKLYIFEIILFSLYLIVHILNYKNFKKKHRFLLITFAIVLLDIFVIIKLIDIKIIEPVDITLNILCIISCVVYLVFLPKLLFTNFNKGYEKGESFFNKILEWIYGNSK